MVRKLAAIMGLAFGLLAPTSAFAQSATLPASETALIDAVIDPLLAGLSGQSSRSAVAGFFATGTSDLPAEQLDQVVEKIDSALEMFGPVQRCEMFDQQLRSTLIVQRKYACQQRDRVSHWTFILKRLPDRWAAQKLSFSTDVEELF